MKVGLFDSGIGGLSVLGRLLESFPNWDYVYLADTFRSPFGTKSQKELERIVMEDLEFLIEEKVDLIVAACNTADSIMEDLPKLPVPYIGIIESAVEAVNGNRIAVLATEATVKSEVYVKKLGNRETFQRAIQPLVAVVENNPRDFSTMDSMLQEALKEVRDWKPDEVILGCTHFSVISDRIGKFLRGVRIIDPAVEVTKRLRDINGSGSGKVLVYSTSDVEELKKKVNSMGIFGKVKPIYRQVNLYEKSDSYIGAIGSR